MKMTDEFIKMFNEEFGEATSRAEVADETCERWRGKLPDKLLTFWKEEGWCGYRNGLLWITDPDDYEDLVEGWLEGTLLDELDIFHVVARTAFGSLYLCGEKSGQSVKVNPAIHGVFALKNELKPKSPRDRDFSINSFLMSGKSDFDLDDENGDELFNRTLSKLGPVASDEVYGFEPALVLGGRMLIENLRKVKLHQHLMILRQLAPPRMPFSNIDIDKLLSK